MVMTMAACFTVFAAETPHSITIENTNTSISIDGKEYKAYKLFDSTQNADKTAYSYYMNVENQFYVNTGTKAVVEKYFTLTEIAGDASKVSVTPKDGFDARKFGDEMQKFLARPVFNGDGKCLIINGHIFHLRDRINERLPVFVMFQNEFISF